MNAKVATLGLALGLVAGTAIASNTGFKLNYQITAPAGKSQNNPVSFPYFYYADGVVGGPQDSVKLCKDVNDLAPSDPVPTTAPKVGQVLQFQPAIDQFRIQSCTSSKVSFTVAPGEAYVLKPVNNTNQVVNIVGSQDDEYARNKLNTKTVTILAPAGKSQNNYVSIPYHITAVDSVGVCKDANGLLQSDPVPTVAPKIGQVLSFNVASDQFRIQSCTSSKVSFPVTPGEGLVLKPVGGVTQQVNFTVY